MLRAFNGPSSLIVEEVGTPVLGRGDLLVAVKAVSVNRTLDLAVMTGRWPVPPPLPHVPGVDPAGQVIGVGPGVEGWRVGDRVAVGTARCGVCVPCLEGRNEECERTRNPGVAGWGGLATHVIAPASSAHRVPENVSWPDAVSAARHGALAIHMLDRRVSLRPGERVLVTGAVGGLGAAAVQVAAARGAEVIAAAGGDRASAALAWGAARAVAYDELSALAGEVDVVVETTGVPTVWEAAVGALRRGGRLVGSAASGDALARLDLRRLYVQRLTVAGASLGRIVDGDQALALASSGRLRSPIAASFTLDRVRDAYAFAADRAAGLIGKIIIEPGKAS